MKVYFFNPSAFKLVITPGYWRTHMNGENNAAQGTKPSNPKDAIGSDKLPLHLWPAAASALGCIGMLEGLVKYGRNNFRFAGIRYSIYLDACKRHLDALLEAEDHAPDTGTPHLANALACLGIIADAMANGTLIDDRNYVPKPGHWRHFIDHVCTPHVARLKKMFAHKSPKHYTVQDNINADIDRQFGVDLALKKSLHYDAQIKAGFDREYPITGAGGAGRAYRDEQTEARIKEASIPTMNKTQDYKCVNSTGCDYPVSCPSIRDCGANQLAKMRAAERMTDPMPTKTVEVSADGVHTVDQCTERCTGAGRVYKDDFTPDGRYMGRGSSPYDLSTGDKGFDRNSPLRKGYR